MLDAARDLLDSRPLAEISLRELGRRVGLATSNVVRYFPTREAVFLAVLVDDWSDWLEDVGERLARPGGPGPPAAARARAAEVVAGTLAERPRLCALVAAAPAVLERNVPLETAREFKTAALERTERLGRLLADAVPGLAPQQATRLAGLVWVLVAGAWPMATPTPVVRQVLAEPGYEAVCVDFAPDLGATLKVLLDGMLGPA
ncbi:TetR family transcriptional regulator [Thalassiella azotivora]